jgi:hypothetical protein
MEPVASDALIDAIDRQRAKGRAVNGISLGSRPASRSYADVKREILGEDDERMERLEWRAGVELHSRGKNKSRALGWLAEDENPGVVFNAEAVRAIDEMGAEFDQAEQTWHDRPPLL